MKAAALGLLTLLFASGAGSGEAAECSIIIERREHSLLVRTDLEALSPGTYSFGYDPSCESLELLSADFVRPGRGEEELPDWAVDTLTGTDGYPLALMVVFPPGSAGSMSFVREMFDRLSLESPSLEISPPVADAEMAVLVRDAPSSLRWEGGGYVAERDGEDLLLNGAGPAGQLALSWIDGWDDLYEALSADADSALLTTASLSSREAAIEAGAAGADPSAQLARLRTMLCNSFRMSLPSAAGLRFEVGPLDEVYLRRRATPLEASTIFCSICRQLGMECDFVFASGGNWTIPVASSWSRVLLRITAGGRTFYVEPSATLVPAFYIQSSREVSVLGRGDRMLRSLPESGYSSSSCSESWEVCASGAFRMEVEASGGYDVEIRKKLAGPGEAGLAILVSTWLWRSGYTLEVDSVWTSDLYDLGESAEFGAVGTLPPLAEGYLLLPSLSWNTSSDGHFIRTWKMPSTTRTPPDLTSSALDGFAIFSDTLPRSPRRMARIEGIP
jgi:hypothetical protein